MNILINVRLKKLLCTIAKVVHQAVTYVEKFTKKFGNSESSFLDQHSILVIINK